MKHFSRPGFSGCWVWHVSGCLAWRVPLHSCEQQQHNLWFHSTSIFWGLVCVWAQEWKRWMSSGLYPLGVYRLEWGNQQKRSENNSIKDQLDQCGAFPGGSAVKNPPAVQETSETWVWSPGREALLEEGMVTLSSILAWRIPWTGQRSLVGYSP